MAESTTTITATIPSYPNPLQLLKRSVYLGVAGVVGVVAAKVFVPNLNFKAQFVFSQVLILTFNLIFLNNKINKAVANESNPLKKNVKGAIWGLSYTIIPCIFSKVVVSMCIRPLSIPQSFIRGLYYGTVVMVISCGYSHYRRAQKKPEF
jgi:hypothetical protein